MKKIFLSLLSIMMIISLAASVAQANPGCKLKNGLKEVITAPGEIPRNTAQYTRDTDLKPLGFVGGLLEGTVEMLNQGVGGIVSILTFPFSSDDIDDTWDYDTYH